MNEAEIAERFIAAAETNRKRQVKGTKPTEYGSAMPEYVRTRADMNGWGRSHGDHLLPGDDPLAEERRRFWEGETTRPSAAAISCLEQCERWTAVLVSSPDNRRALWAWAKSKAGGQTFASWCFKVEGIHPETGRRRKDRAISQIASALGGNVLQHKEMQGSGVLFEGAISAYFADTVEDEAPKGPRDFSWRSDPALRPVDDPANRDTRWAERQTERRRQMAERPDLKRGRSA
ncbi:hypothetical protein GTW51_18985 [Aurantimonas aggregata]|uniref:Uncharacterized protein n=1 Tax=Aurantimonas aggregata TaxID=2047720 RepID=A0A6L9MLK1_9HYPH|nr:hypothetical protein [Aurantimonas aggregata]NDV88784.1 hypothetical protein [Aurantimonas aggregata]